MMLYLDHAATSFPKDPRVIEAVRATLTDVAGSPDRGGDAGAAGAILWHARQRCARLLGVADAAGLVFTHSATEGLNLALKGLLRSGDEVVTTQVEHNSVLRPLRGLQARHSLRVIEVEADSQGQISAEHLLEQIGPATRCVVLAHASNVTGGLQPVVEVGRELRRRRAKTTLVVDVAQTAGYRPLDDVAEVADVLVAAGHKGPGGPLGTGFLWHRSDVILEPLLEGGTGSQSESTRQPLGILEAGSPNVPGIAGLSEALRIRLEEQELEQVQTVRARAAARFFEQARAIKGVTLYGPEPGMAREAVFPFRVQGLSVEEAAVALESVCEVWQRAGLHCAPGMHQALHTGPAGTLRFSLAALPTSAEIEGAVQALRILAGDT